MIDGGCVDSLTTESGRKTSVGLASKNYIHNNNQKVFLTFQCKISNNMHELLLTLTKLTPKQTIQAQPPSGATFFVGRGTFWPVPLLFSTVIFSLCHLCACNKVYIYL